MTDRHEHAQAESDAWDDAHKCSNEPLEQQPLLEPNMTDQTQSYSEEMQSAEVINHEEAKLLANMKQVESNLARAYLDHCRTISALEASMNSMAETNVKLGASLSNAHEREIELLAVIEQKDKKIIAAKEFALYEGVEQLLDEAIAITPSLSTLNEHDARVLEEAADWFTAGSKNSDISSRVFVKDALVSFANELRRMASERRKSYTLEEHTTKGTWCWCDPEVEERPDGSLLVIHQKE